MTDETTAPPEGGPTLRVEEAPAAAAPAGQGPSMADQLADNAAAVDVLAGKLGTITFRKPHILSGFRLVEALGDLASNQTYMEMVNPLLWLAAINGDPVFQPTSKLEVEALIQRLGEDGLEALMQKYFAVVVQPALDRMNAAAEDEKRKAALKNV